MPTLCVGDLEFPMKFKYIPKLEKMNNVTIIVFDLNETNLSPV